MKIKDILDKIKDLDPEMEVTTAISEDCCSEYAMTYGLDPNFSVEIIYGDGDLIFIDADELKEQIAYEAETEDESKINELFDKVPRSTKLVITVSP